MNDQFRTKEYMLVKVRYNSHGRGVYTYACKKKFKADIGSMVVVSTGVGDASVDSMRVAEVTAISHNLKHVPNNIEIKEVIQCFSID